MIRPSASSASQTATVGSPGAEQGDELLAGLGGPGHGQRARGRRRQRAGRRAGRAAARPVRRRRRRAAGSTGSRSGRAARASTTSPSCSTTPSASGVRSGRRGLPPPSMARSRGRTAPGAQHAADLAPGHVAGVRDGAGRLVHLPQQGVGVEQAEFGGDLVLFLEREPVGGAAGGQVQGVADVEQPARGRRRGPRAGRRRARRRRRRAARWRRAARRGPP